MSDCKKKKCENDGPKPAPSPGGGSGTFGPVASGSGTFGPVAAGSGTFGPVASGGRPFGPTPSSPRHTFRNGVTRGLGWFPDASDFRDYTLSSRLDEHKDKEIQKENKALFKRVRSLGDHAEDPSSLPSKVDNSGDCSPIEDQGNLGSCTAHAAVGMVEYMERRATGTHINASHLFHYKVTRNLLGWTGDTGAFLRTAMKSLVLFGVPPQKFWSYDVDTYEYEPDAFLYSYASNYKSMRYLRLDPTTDTTAQALNNVKSALAHHYVVMLGFTVYSSLDNQPDIPFPSLTDDVDGGHAVLAVGYDDDHENRVDENNPDALKRGALKIRNSWGKGWGKKGYGWLPYDYVTSGLANDFWTCLQQSWVDEDQFEFDN